MHAMLQGAENYNFGDLPKYFFEYLFKIEKIEQ